MITSSAFTQCTEPVDESRLTGPHSSELRSKKKNPRRIDPHRISVISPFRSVRCPISCRCISSSMGVVTGCFRSTWLWVRL